MTGAAFSEFQDMVEQRFSVDMVDDIIGAPRRSRAALHDPSPATLKIGPRA